VEYLSISRIIYRSKAKYERAFLCVEKDDFDLSYFILYHLEVMEDAFNELKDYLSRKIQERSTLKNFISIPGITRRQAEILRLLDESPETIFSAKQIASRFGLNVKSIRTDLRNLTKLDIASEVLINGREFGYTRAHDLEAKVDMLKERK
jgi:Fic family protein